MKRKLHRFEIQTDDSGMVTGVLMDGKKVEGCTGISVECSGSTSWLNVTISMEAAYVGGFVDLIGIKSIRNPIEND